MIVQSAIALPSNRLHRGLNLLYSRALFKVRLCQVFVKTLCSSTTAHERISIMKNTTLTASIEQLLSKPFDELTAQEWEQLRKYKPRKRTATAA
ncbi:hypothetical protein [Nostoc commune]|nr:hypothetical protein [Nostoc commune]